MIRVAAITAGAAVPSSRFRIRQHISPLRQFDIEVRDFCPAIGVHAPIPLIPQGLRMRHIFPVPFYVAWQAAKLVCRLPGVVGSHDSQITWLSRQLMPGYNSLERFLKRPLILDVDDAVWLTLPFGRRSAAAAAGMADVVVVGNDYLANWFEPFSRSIHVLPTAVDTDIYKPLERRADRPFTVGWIGTSGNLVYLESIEKPLMDFIAEYPDVIIRVVSNAAPGLKSIPRRNVEYIQWAEDREVHLIQDMDIGLMPLNDSDWTLGKCAFKMIQYMACGLPVVVSPTGMNTEVLALGNIGFAARTAGEWLDALVSIYENRAMARTMGLEGRKVAIDNFSRSMVTQRIAEIMTSLVDL